MFRSSIFTPRIIARYLFIFAISLIPLFPSKSHALSRYYFEMGGSLNQFRGTSAFFEGSPNTIGFGFGFNFGMMINVAPPSQGIGIHLGIIGRYDSASTDTTSYGLVGAYPAIRFEFKRIFGTLGITPLVWRRMQPDAGFGGYQLLSGYSAIMTEAGYIWPITPEVSFIGCLGMGFASPTAKRAFSPKPLIDLGVTLRFYLFANSSMKDTGQAPKEWRDDFEGWRYPYGKEIR